MRDAKGLRLITYDPQDLDTTLPDGTDVHFDIVGRYPVDPNVLVSVTVSKPTRFALRLRIPHWSARTQVKVDQVPVSDVRAGTYLVLDREWSGGTTIRLTFDFAPRLWVGERESDGRSSVYRGPILLAYDRRLNPDEDDPSLDIAAVRGMRPVIAEGSIMAMQLTEANGRSHTLCDFASAGQDGSPYRSWLKVSGAPAAVPFARERPWRAVPVEASP
jgi:DUF1680 family protein